MFKNTNGAIALTAALITLTAMLITTVSISSLRISRLGNSTDFSNAVSAYNNALALRDEIQADGDVDNFYTPDTTAHCNPTSGNPIWEPNGGYLYCIDDAASVLELRVRANSGAIIQKVALNVQTETFESPLNCAVVPGSFPASMQIIQSRIFNTFDDEGKSVGISGNRFISGAPGASVGHYEAEAAGVPIAVESGEFSIFEWTGSDWDHWRIPITSPLHKTHHRMGDAVDIYGSYALIGAPEANGAQGLVHVFERQGLADWGNEITLRSPTYRGRFDKFGFDIDLECYVAVITAPGRAFFHGTDQSEPDDWHYFSGTVYIFEKLAGVNEWVVREQLGPPIPEEKLQFGTSIDLKGDKIIVGAIGDKEKPGKAYVFTQITPTDWGVGVELVNPDPVNGDGFGTGVAIEGTHAFVGAAAKDTARGDDAGVVYHFEEIAPGNWVLQNTLNPPELHRNSQFGKDIAMDNGNVMIGAAGWSANGWWSSRPGGVFHYQIGGAEWPDFEDVYGGVNSLKHLGTSVAIDGDSIVAGGPGSSAPAGGQNHIWKLP